MYVCVCKAITDKELRVAVLEGAKTTHSLRKKLGCINQCGKCEQQVCEIRDEVINNDLKTPLFC
jgi:bacterioferritin-associated ferredoxin|tara:strand:+ start:986 stop:1177 length:192 start_codon:yes stop_codon:yes gene_type:complete